MRTLQPFSVFGICDQCGHWHFVVIAPLINCILVEVWLDDIHFAEMAPAVTTFAHTSILMMMTEIYVMQFAGCLRKFLLLGLTLLVIVS